MERMQLLEDLFKAYYDARKNKRNTVNQMRFEVNFEREIFSLCDDILNRTYVLRPSICFVVEKPVKREVFAADFRDRVIHHLIFNYINPILEPQFIDDSYSCRIGRGTLFGIHRVADFIRSCSENYTKDCYILKLDIRGYFMNIDKPILSKQLTEMMKKKEEVYAKLPAPQPDWDMVQYLIDKVIYHDPRTCCIIKGKLSDWDGLPTTKSLLHNPTDRGLPIGNLTSQLFSNVYLNVFDRYIQNELGMQYYGRYVDDFVVIDSSNDRLKQLIRHANQFLNNELKLELHPLKVYLQHYSKGVQFLGSYIKPNRIYVAERTKKNLIRSVRHWNKFLSEHKPEKKDLILMRANINSYLGIMQHFSSFRIRKKILWEANNEFLKYGYLSENIKKFSIYEHLLLATI
jgi:retron-type reverse transcriptase